MAKKKKKTEDVIDNVKEMEITKAVLRDGFCDYTYQVNHGSDKGDKHNVKGTGLIMDDLRNAFDKLKVHLAVMDEGFKSRNIEVENIDNFHDDEITDMYRVDSIEFKGSSEDESVIITGTKYTSVIGEHLEVKTPKVRISENAFYKWKNELKTIADEIRMEVELYKNGKREEVQEEFVDKTQTSILDENQRVEEEAF